MAELRVHAAQTETRKGLWARRTELLSRLAHRGLIPRARLARAAAQGGGAHYTVADRET